MRATMKPTYDLLRPPVLGFYFLTIFALLFLESEINLPFIVTRHHKWDKKRLGRVKQTLSTAETRTIPSPSELNVYRDVNYLPNSSQINNEHRNENTIWKEHADELWKSFDEIQSNCSKSFYKISIPQFGVSSSILHVINVVWRHWMMDKSIVVDPKSRFKWESSSNNNKNEKTVIWPSLLRPLDQTCMHQQNISISMVDQYPKEVVDVWDHPKIPDGHLWDASIVGRAINMNNTSNTSTRTTPPSMKHLHYGEWFRNQYGDLIFSAVVTAYFIKTPILERPSKDCIAVHIRRGDSCGKGDGYQQEGYQRSCPPFQTFFEGALQMKQKYGWDDIFVATDSPDMETILSVAKQYGFTNVRYQRMDRNKYNTTTLIDNRIKAIANNGEAAYEVYTDIKELISCKGLVGPLHSTMDMLVLQLLVYIQGKIVPFISVDDPWCPEFGGNNFCPSYKKSCKCVDIPHFR